MPYLKTEPQVVLTTLADLFAVAAAMEAQAIESYRALAERMHSQNAARPAAIFEGMAHERCWRLAEINRRSERVTGARPDMAPHRDNQGVFDDEGMGGVAPELQSPYRAFSVAVRNAERAFAFWTYAASGATKSDLRQHAEQMARDALAHIASLRRERRRAFHAARKAGTSSWTLPALERRLGELLTARGPEMLADAVAVREKRERLARQARQRAHILDALPAEDLPVLVSLPADAFERARPVAEILLDAYLDLGQSAAQQTMRDAAQAHAAQLLDCLAFIGSPSS